ncbi:two-component sensor histidine kinase [Rhodoferax koreense]|uniref:Sensor protein n=1 Tax=Rhodoferax koreensis TaxID=1842727 RepID=A0A1P8K2G3_9BURK|nr:heavy metal sensor histidine kinase [Rhodoferax koreense]APW40208.1 two-component sensor histidine kinase [Rhodoferax koreense]
MKRSITARLVLMFAAAALLTFALIGAALYTVLDRELTRHQDNELRIALKSMAYSIQHVGRADRWARVQARMDTLAPQDGNLRFWVLSDDPRFGYGTGLADVQRMTQDADGRGAITLPGQADAMRTQSVYIEPLDERPGVRLIIGGDSTPYRHTREAFLTALLALSLAAVLAVAWAGYWITRVGLKPLERLSAEALALRPKTLSQRLEVAALPVELTALTEAFNGALARLEEAYAQLEAFNADVAHELRTPLANLIGGTQVALSRQRAAPELEDVLASNLEDLERLRSIVNDMLFLARADRGEVATALVETPVAAEVRKTIEFFEFVLDESGSQVRIEGDLALEARLETALFRRAMSNLLQNAIDHSPPGAQLVVRLREEAGAIWITVANPGEPIARSHLQHLFDRFYRVDAARTGPGQHHGHGLGLAIVKAVAGMHGGQVAALSAAGVNTFGFSVAKAVALPN